MSNDDYNINVIFFSPIVIASLFYSYFISSNLPKGIYRLISLLPIFYLFTILPLHLSSPFTTAVAALFFTWLANFKLLLFAFDQGPLYPPKSLINFITIASFPIKTKSNSIKPKKKPRLNFAVQLLIFPILLNCVGNFKHNLNPYIVLTIYCVLIYLLVDLLVLLSNIMIRRVIGIELEQPSDEPYLATSLQDFWGRRWNLMVSNILRLTIYKPVKSLFSGKVWDSLPAILATFVVSGLMHELLVYFLTRERPTWDMTLFFVLHGICVVVELIMKRELSGKFELPVVVTRLLTVGFVVVSSFWLFFPPLITSGADVKALDEFKLLADYVKIMLKS